MKNPPGNSCGISCFAGQRLSLQKQTDNSLLIDSIPLNLDRVLDLISDFWLFCTDRQLSACYFIQFCILTKIGIEIPVAFVYNVFIVVLATQL